MILLITYDLLKPTQNYTGLYEAIKSCGVWWHHLDSVWLIETSTNPKEILEQLKQHIDANDKLLVIQVSKNWWGMGFQQRAYDWLKNRVF